MKIFLIQFSFKIVFKAKPPTPPSPGQTLIKSDEISNKSFLESIKILFTNRNYIFLFIAYGTNVGAYYAISTLLNPVSNNYSLITV